MKPQIQSASAFFGAIALVVSAGTPFTPRALADELHVHDTLKECDIQFSPDLTQGSFERWTREVGDIIVYKNTGTEVLRAGRTELALSYMSTPVDQHSDAWNDTFHHPNADHPLGDAIEFPAIYGRVGIGHRMDLGAYFTMNPEASYRFTGLGLKYDLSGDSGRWLDLAASLDYGLLFGPDDTMIHAVGTNLHAGHGWRPVSVYAAGGMTWAHGEEMSPVVDLASTNTSSPQLSIGATPHVWGMFDIDFRARFSAVNTYEIKLGYGF